MNKETFWGTHWKFVIGNEFFRFDNDILGIKFKTAVNGNATLPRWTFSLEFVKPVIFTLRVFWHPKATRIWKFNLRAKLLPIWYKITQNIRSQYDMIRMRYEGTGTIHEGIRWTNDDNTNMQFCSKNYYGVETMLQRRAHDGFTTSYWEYDAYTMLIRTLTSVRYPYIYDKFLNNNYK